MHIMNVRYSNEIQLEKSIDSRLLDMLFSGMILQPVIENSLNHGLVGVEWEKRILFSVRQEQGDEDVARSEAERLIQQENMFMYMREQAKQTGMAVKTLAVFAHNSMIGQEAIRCARIYAPLYGMEMGIHLSKKASIINFSNL